MDATTITRPCFTPEAAPAGRIAALAKDRGAAGTAPLAAPLFHQPEAKVSAIADSVDWSFQDGLTLEAWIRPGALPPGGGRIVDKTTPGVSDGLLFDTGPGHSLRLIVGGRQKDLAEVLKPGVWQHVAVVIGKSRFDVYLNGEK